MPLHLAQLMIRFPSGLPRGAVACRTPSACSSGVIVRIFGKSVWVLHHQLLVTRRPRRFYAESEILERVPKHKVV